MNWAPLVDGVYVTVHEDHGVPGPGTSVHVALDGLKLPGPFELNVTVPVGGVGAVDVSKTLARHVTAAFGITAPGEQVTTVTVGFTTSTITVVGVVVAPRGLPVTTMLYEPIAAVDAALTVNTLIPVGLTGFVEKLTQATGPVTDAHDRLTGWVFPLVRVANIATVPDVPARRLTGPLFERE